MLMVSNDAFAAAEHKTVILQQVRDLHAAVQNNPKAHLQQAVADALNLLHDIVAGSKCAISMKVTLTQRSAA